MSLKEPSLLSGGTEDSSTQDLKHFRAPRWQLLTKSVAKKAVLVVALLTLWWIITATKALPPFAVPSPLVVAKVTKSSLHGLLAQSWVTAQRIVIAVVAIWVIGAISGILVGMTPRLWPVLGLGRALYAIPVVIVYPLLGVWFGVGGTSKIVFAFMSGIFPMLLMSAAAVRSINDDVFLLFASLGVGRLSTFRRAVLPAALPGVVGAMRLSGSLGLVSVVVGEMLLGSNGIGYWITNAGSQSDGPTLYEGIIVVLIFAALMNGLVGFLEQRVAVAYG